MKIYIFNKLFRKRTDNFGTQHQITQKLDYRVHRGLSHLETEANHSKIETVAILKEL